MTPCDLGAGGPCRGAAWISIFFPPFKVNSNSRPFRIDSDKQFIKVMVGFWSKPFESKENHIFSTTTNTSDVGFWFIGCQSRVIRNLLYMDHHVSTIIFSSDSPIASTRMDGWYSNAGWAAATAAPKWPWLLNSSPAKFPTLAQGPSSTWLK